jgi:hypothetical protein
MSIIIMVASSVERVLLIRILNVVAEHAPFIFVRFVVADYFAVSDLSVFRDGFQIDEETFVGSWNVTNSLE